MKVLAETLLASPQGRGNAQLFAMLARVWYGEQKIICRKLEVARVDRLTHFGLALHLSKCEIQRQRQSATQYADAQCRVEIGRTPSVNQRRWVVQDENGRNQIVTR